MRNKFFLSFAVLALGAVSQADVVLDQVPLNMADVGNLFASQDFETSFDAFDCATIEDFSVTASQTLVTKVEVMMGGFSGFTSPAQWANVTGYRLNFYTSVASAAGNLVGNAGSMNLTPGQVTLTDPGYGIYSGTLRKITINTNLVLPGAGTYWVGVTAIMDAGTAVQQIGVAENLVTTGGDNAMLVNPGGGFGLPGNSQLVNGGAGGDAAYRVEATAVPEPGSMIALGLGAAALAARRRRKAA